MNEIELLEQLIQSAAVISYERRNEFDSLNRKTEMVIRKVFGPDSHYLDDVKKIRYSPIVVWGLDDLDEFRSPFESGLTEFRNVLNVMLDDLKLTASLKATSTQQSRDNNLSIEEIKLISDLVSKNKISEAISTAIDIFFDKREKKKMKSCILLNSRLNELKNKEINAIISDEEARLEKSKIRHSLLELLD